LPHNLSHEELLQEYLKLQSRVTRFSAKEQELINVRDLLDQELVGYKRMNEFHTAAIEVHEVPQLLELIAETLVDLFEMEIGFACFRHWVEQDRYHCHLEGAGKFKGEMQEALHRLCADQEGVYDWKDGLTDEGMPLARYMLGKKHRSGSAVEMVVVAGVSQEKARTYGLIDRRKYTLFQLFVESCSAHLERIFARERIQAQLETIRKSELELRRLSLIATNINSGVIITDAKARIVWVNDAFKKTTGYLEEEVIGKKPKDFLQAEGLNGDETLHRLSRALQQHENVSVDLKNVRKNGEVFYLRLTISPVRDQENQLVNFIAIQQDITDEKVSESKMLKQNEELIKINQELDQFVYSISHDLRAPLLSIQGLLGLINTQGLRDENREYLGLIGESTKRLDQTILEILNYSRNARLDVQFESFNLKTTMANILSDLGSMRLDVKTTLDWSGEEEVVQDEIRVGVLLKNIIANAIKYSKPGGGAWVEVRAIATPQAMQIIITDNGEGIDTHHLRQVFDMFYRATTSSPGTGLGLYVSKEITEKIGGTISIESTLNIGTEVTIILPQHEHEQISID
jgi:PAS domain S-box-containing protein